MNTTVQQYDEANQALDAVIDAVPADRWSDPSPCEGWAAGDVIRHMIQTQREFLTDRGFDVGIAPDPDVDPAAAWRNHAERVIEVLRDDSVVAAGYDGYFGPTTVGATMEQFYIWDMLVHRWDVATSAGLDAGSPTPSSTESNRRRTASARACTWRASASRVSRRSPTTTGRSACSPGSAGAPDAGGWRPDTPPRIACTADPSSSGAAR